MSAEDNQRNFERRLLRVLDYISDNLDGDLSLDVLADVACMSRFHWHRIFRAATGETLAEATRRVRMLKAANALILDPAPVAEIGRRFGYADAASFARAFRAFYLMTPAEFRERGVAHAIQYQTSPGDDAMHKVTIETLAPARAAGVLHVGPYPEISSAFQKLGGVLAARNLFPHARGMAAIYHDGPGSKPEADMRSHAVVLIADTFPADIEGLEYFDLVGGRHAVLAHKGPYGTLGAAYDWLYGKWLPQSGEEPRDAPPVEFYVNNPTDTPPDQLRTDIRLPLV